MKTVFKNSKARSTDAIGILIGRQLLDAGKLSERDVTRIVEAQHSNNLRFGETAVDLGLLSEEDLQVALARQYSYPCLTVGESSISPALYAANNPFGRQSEAIRTLRSQLLLRWFDDRHKSIAVTSCRYGEDSSSLAANLAIVFAQLGERTLLIDANLREPAQHKLFGLSPSSGLSTLLSGRCDVESVLTPVAPFENLTVIGAGAAPPNPQELLSRVTFSYLVETAPALFDVIILDTPPMLQFADAQLVTSLVGACILTTIRHRTRVSDIESVQRTLAGSRAQIVGAVVVD